VRGKNVGPDNSNAGIAGYVAGVCVWRGVYGSEMAGEKKKQRTRKMDSIRIYHNRTVGVKGIE